jgi:hypothetical protein
MTDHVVTLAVSEEVYELARRLAETTAQPIEEILQQRLEAALPLPRLPADDEAELAALSLLSDDALWTIAAEQMPRAQQERRLTLLRLNERKALTDTDQAELDDLLLRGDRLMLRKAEAAAILKQRGFAVSSQDLAAPHE